mgnify:CR=1 FL=1
MEKLDIVLQGPYNNDFVNEIALHYLALAFVNNIIISHHTHTFFPFSFGLRSISQLAKKQSQST